MAIAKSTEGFLAEVYDDGRVNPAELMSARELADTKSQAVAAELGSNNDFTAFQKSCDVTVQLMQNVAIGLGQEDEITDLGRAYVIDALQAQFAYLKMSLEMVESALL